MKRVFGLAASVMCGAAAMGLGAGEPPANDTDKTLATMPVFTKDDPWHKDVSKEAIDPRSAAIVASIGVGKPLHPDFGTKYGIPLQLVDKRTPRVTPTFRYAGESDKGPYPMPNNVLIEGGPDAPKGSDRHILCIDREGGKLYELYNAVKDPAGWTCGSGAIFDLTKASVGQRKAGWTSADAAGLPIFPGLVRYDEVGVRHKIDHAIRFTVVKSRNAYVAPASHFASSKTDPNLPPMGMRVRLKASVDIATFPADDQVILTALKTYGMILADNGSDWFISGAPDARWNDEDLNALKKVKGSDFEVLRMALPAADQAGPVRSR